MKTSQFLLGAFCAASVSAASAQSTVTLYGIIDEGVDYNSNIAGGRTFQLYSGVISGSRWGIRGSEDLGDGYRAVFTLEDGFDASNGTIGQGGLIFGRQAFVGIGTPYGTFTFGRQYDVDADDVGPFEAGAHWAGNIGAHPADLDNFNLAYRDNNSIKFKSTAYHGLSFGLAYGLGGVAGDVTRNQTWSLGTTYTYANLSIGAGYHNVRNPNVGYFGNSTTGTPSSSVSNTKYPLFSGFLSARTYQVASFGGEYHMGKAIVGMTYSNVAFKDMGDLSSGPNPYGYTGSVHFNNAEINLRYFVTPALLLGAGYDYTKGSSVSGSRGTHGGASYHQAMAGVDYFFSKSTDVYLIGVYQKASGTDSRDMPAVATILNQSPSDNNRQAVLRIGIRHRF